MSDTKIVDRTGDTKARGREIDAELDKTHGDIHAVTQLLKNRLADPSVPEEKKAAIRAELRKLANKCDSKCEVPALPLKPDGGKPVQA